MKLRMSARRQSGTILAIVTLALLHLSAVRGAYAETIAAEGSIRKAPDFTLEDINPRSDSHGKRLDLAELYADTGLILNFIASWCKPCWPELASFQKLSADGLPIVCIAADEYGGTSDVLRKAEQLGLSMPILHVPREQISAMEELYDHAMLPATYVIDPLGGVREVFLGAISPEALLEEARASLP